MSRSTASIEPGSAVPELVVVGCPSMDRLETPAGTVIAPGGAGFNTALAARGAGITVGLVAAITAALPREIARAFGPGGLDRAGLVVRDGLMPSFHIGYDQALNARYHHVELGVELLLDADDFPERWLATRHVHLSPLGASSRNQLAFARRLRARGFSGTLSAGCFLLDGDGEVTRALAAECSVVFLNRVELAAVFPEGPPGDGTFTVCVTEGADGASVHRGGVITHRPALPADVVDTTGAGDAFAGGYLAGLLGGSDPLDSALRWSAIAISDHGSTALVTAVAARVGPRVEVDTGRIAALGPLLARHARTSALDFTGFPLPDRGVPWALDCLAVATLHQYGFWTSDGDGWVAPMYAFANGERFKGSDFIWQAFTRAAATDPSVLDPARLAAEGDLFDRICTDDGGSCPVPHLESHRQLQQAYGMTLVEQGHRGFGDLLATVADSVTPGRDLLERLARLPGYAEDPLAKKANLLVVILANRPERFLDLKDPRSVTPIVDYHLMRSCLRTGCVVIADPELRRRVEKRRWVDEWEEEQIRSAAFDAINGLVSVSGLDQASVDGFFFTNARRVCVETAEPDCPSCPLEPECAAERDLFQPVFRTTAY